jgi:hypothetical protein
MKKSICAFFSILLIGLLNMGVTQPRQRTTQNESTAVSLADSRLSIRVNFVAPTSRPMDFDSSEAWMALSARLFSKNSLPLASNERRKPFAASSPSLHSLQLQSMPSTAMIKPSPFLKWVGAGAFCWAAFFDHYQDGITDAPGGKSHLWGADYRHWHFIKNLAHVGYLTAGFAAGMELGQKKVTPKRLVKRMVGEVMLYWFIQNIVYDKAVNDVWFDYKRKYTTDGMVVFDLKGRDHRIELSKWSRPLLDVVRLVGGMYLVIKN